MTEWEAGGGESRSSGIALVRHGRKTGHRALEHHFRRRAGGGGGGDKKSASAAPFVVYYYHRQLSAKKLQGKKNALHSLSLSVHLAIATTGAHRLIPFKFERSRSLFSLLLSFF